MSSRVLCGLVRLGTTAAPADSARLAAAAAAVSERLYVLLEGDWSALHPPEITRRLSAVYGSVQQQDNGRVDARVLLPSPGSVCRPPSPPIAARAAP